jgi:hypothetical protein
MLTVGQLKALWKNVPDDAVIVIGETSEEVKSISTVAASVPTEMTKGRNMVDVLYVWIHVD